MDSTPAPSRSFSAILLALLLLALPTPAGAQSPVPQSPPSKEPVAGDLTGVLIDRAPITTVQIGYGWDWVSPSGTRAGIELSKGGGEGPVFLVNVFVQWVPSRRAQSRTCQLPRRQVHLVERHVPVRIEDLEAALLFLQEPRAIGK